MHASCLVLFVVSVQTDQVPSSIAAERPGANHLQLPSARDVGRDDQICRLVDIIGRLLCLIDGWMGGWKKQQKPGRHWENGLAAQHCEHNFGSTPKCSVLDKSHRSSTTESVVPIRTTEQHRQVLQHTREPAESAIMPRTEHRRATSIMYSDVLQAVGKA